MRNARMQNQEGTKQSWEEKRVQYIDGLKKPTEAQQLLAILYKKANRTEAENKKLAALIKAEKATEPVSYTHLTLPTKA